jgi:cysteinyl-tRNA synthetase
VFEFVRGVNAELDRGAGAHPALAAAFDRVMGVFDVLPEAKAVDAELARWVEERIAAREQARKSKDFKEADRIRAELKARKVEIEDTPQGPKWRVA